MDNEPLDKNTANYVFIAFQRKTLCSLGRLHRSIVTGSDLIWHHGWIQMIQPRIFDG